MGSNCPICLEDFVGKTRASPDACDHIFCLPCLEKWSKLGSYCPVDRKRYKKIFNLDSDDVVQVKPKPRKRKRHMRTLYDFSTACEICSQDDKPDVLLLCDCCDLGFHLCCLSPPLNEIPAGLWFCPTCIAVEKKLKEKKGITKEVEAELSSGREISTNIKCKSKIETEESKTSQNENCKNNSILEACRNIITEFEDITVEKNCRKVDSNSSILNDSFNQIDRIYKTFDFEPKTTTHKNVKYSKTYDLQSKTKKKEISTLPNKDKLHKSSTLESLNKNLRDSNVDDMCLKNNISNDINLLERYLSDSISCGYMKPDAFNEKDFELCEDQVQNSDVSEICNQNEFCSSSNCSQLKERLKDAEVTKETVPDSAFQTSCFKKQIENSSLNQNNLQETCPTANAGSSKEEMQGNSEFMVTKNTDDLLPSCSSISKGSHKEVRKQVSKCNFKTEIFPYTQRRISKRIRFYQDSKRMSCISCISILKNSRILRTVKSNK